MHLPRPSSHPDLLILTGEHSGDEHAARMLRQAWDRRPGLRVAVIGGENLERLCREQDPGEARGAEGETVRAGQFLFDLTAYSVVGVAEVLRHYGFFRSFFYETVDWIDQHRPRAVLLIDYPGFNLRLAAELAKRGISIKGGGDIRMLYYVSPQIWAWKRGRRFRMAETLDALGCIFPFELAFYNDTELPVEFVGHPFAEPDHQLPVRYDADAPVLLLPGSRMKPVARIFPLLLEGFRRYCEACPEAKAVVVVPGPGIQELIKRIIAKTPNAAGGAGSAPTVLMASNDAPGEADRGGRARAGKAPSHRDGALPLVERISFVRNTERVSASAVLMSSGTMSLVCALAGIPGAIVYRLHPLSYWIGRRVVKVPYIGIANLLLERTLYPEYIQNIDKEALAGELQSATEDPGRIADTQAAARELRNHLDSGERVSAAAWLLRQLGYN